MEVAKNIKERYDHGRVSLSIVEGAKAYSINNPLAFFRPYKEGKEVIELDDGFRVINTSSEKTTDFGTKVALAVIAMVTQGISPEEAGKIKKNLENDIGNKDYHFFNFNTSDFVKNITGYKSTYYTGLVMDAINALASNVTIFQNTNNSDFLRFQWLVPISNKDGVLTLGISRFVLLQTFKNPLSFEPHKLFSLGNKDFRAGLLIENCRTTSKKYALYITNEMAIENIRPRLKHGKPYLKEIEKAFHNAHKKGYPLYKKHITTHRDNPGEITWKNQIEQHQNECQK